MRSIWSFPLLPVFLLASASPAPAGECPHNPNALGVSRVLELDTKDGPLLGTMQYGQTLDLDDKEIVLTFDDGPHEHNTKRVLAALAHHCTKAIFFVIGRKVSKYPSVFSAVEARGHTIGTHSWSHPRNLRRLSQKRAKAEIEKGFNFVQAVASRSIAPFFRFPGLNDSRPLKQFAAKRDYAVFSTDISSDDWMNIGPRTIIRRTIARVKRHGRGILIFHDPGWATGRALPAILGWLKRNGYRIVHVVPKMPYVPASVKNAEKAEGKKSVTE